MKQQMLCGALIAAGSLCAQDVVISDKLVAEKRAMALTLDAFSVQMITGKTVKGAPYSARAVNETVQVLADGNRITRSNATTLYRDSLGRERREESAEAGFISDPVEGANYNLEAHNRVARKTKSMKAVNFVNGTQLTTDHFKTELDHAVVVQMRKEAPKVEHLGTQVIEGVSAEGTRTTTTIPAGEIGNEQPIVTVSERWFSNELQVVVMSTRTDPRTGTTTYKLTNINRSEPSPSLFQVPADYTIYEGGGVIGIRKDEER